MENKGHVRFRQLGGRVNWNLLLDWIYGVYERKNSRLTPGGFGLSYWEGMELLLTRMERP